MEVGHASNFHNSIRCRRVVIWIVTKYLLKKYMAKSNNVNNKISQSQMMYFKAYYIAVQVPMRCTMNLVL